MRRAFATSFFEPYLLKHASPLSFSILWFLFYRVLEAHLHLVTFFEIQLVGELRNIP